MKKGFRNTRNDKKNSKAAYIVIVSVALVLFAIMTAVFAFMLNSADDQNDNPPKKDEPAKEAVNIIPLGDVSGQEMRGIWIATVGNNTFPSEPGLDETKLKAELDDILMTSYTHGINSIFFQVRPCGDAFYNSSVFPSSMYLSGTQGENEQGFDCLEYLLSEAEKYGIDVHAWINPYRITHKAGEKDKLSSNNFAILHPEYTVEYNNLLYLNPAEPQVREHIVDGVEELAKNYPLLSGIHFDDYFYPYPVEGETFDDEDSYQKYGAGADKSDWRRANVNALVKDTYNAVKAINPDLRFGVSVFGIWANSKSLNTPVVGSNTNGLEAYNETYCDALTWINGEYVDYIVPQNYWSFSTQAAPFDEVARWWNANLDGKNVDLYIGHAAYKSADYNKNELYKQVEFSRTLSSYKGSVFFGYENIKNNIALAGDDLKKLYSDVLEKPAVQTDNKDIKITFPDNNSFTSADKTYILGSCDPVGTLYMNGTAVSKTTGGYFSAYVDIKNGRNEFVFTQNDNTYSFVLNKGNQVYTPSTEPKTLSSMTIQDQYPSKEIWLSDDEVIPVSCVAPSGSVVTARLMDNEVVLKPTIYPTGNGKYLYEKYTGTLRVSDDVADDEFTVLGNVEFTARRSGETAQAVGGEISKKGKDAFVYAEVKEDYTHTKVGTTSSFYDDFLPSSKGMRDYVVDCVDGYYKMRFGGYIAKDKLEFTYARPLLMNTILTTAVEVNVKDDTNNNNNTTDIRFGVTENIPVDVDFRGENGEMRIIIYNTDTSIIPQFDVPENPLIESIEGRLGTRDNMLMYFVTFKNNTNFYGFNIVYENGAMILKLNNPQRLKDGSKPLAGKVIVVDAGHGGNDIGAPGPGDKPEKVLNLAIASELASKLRDLGAEVVETRPDDTTLDLYARMDILNEVCPDLAISVHHNSIAQTANAQKVRGFLALYSNNSGVSLATTLSSVICDVLGRDEKATSYQQLAVARNHRFPSALLEMSFISNVEEYQWTITPGNCEKSADAIVEGVIEYYENQEKYLDY